MAEGVYQARECPSWVLAVWKRLLFCVRDGRVGLDDGFSAFEALLAWCGLLGGILRPCAAVWPDGRSLERRSAYALIAAINGPGPMMFMTRLRL